MAGIVEDLLAIARADAGQLSLIPEKIDLEEQVRLVLSAWPPDDASRVDLAIRPAPAWADPLRVRQIVRNLCTNAVRYGADPIRVEVAGGEQARLRVVDSGPGIGEDEREGVFEAFVRGGSGRAHPGSVGLGLAVSRRLARSMGGDLTYRYENGRSIFELVLPATSELPLTTAAPRS